MSNPTINFFGLNRQYQNTKEEILQATDYALRNGQLMNGTFTKQFESWLRDRTGARYAITVHSGTQALEIIATYKHKLHREVMDGDPTIRIPNLTYPATLNAFLNSALKYTGSFPFGLSQEK